MCWVLLECNKLDHSNTKSIGIAIDLQCPFSWSFRIAYIITKKRWIHACLVRVKDVIRIRGVKLREPQMSWKHFSANCSCLLIDLCKLFWRAATPQVALFIQLGGLSRSFLLQIQIPTNFYAPVMRMGGINVRKYLCNPRLYSSEFSALAWLTKALNTPDFSNAKLSFDFNFHIFPE